MESTTTVKGASSVNIKYNKSKRIMADWASKGKRSKIFKSFELGDFFLFELGKDFIGVSINNSYPKGTAWTGARAIKCSDARGLFTYLQETLTDNATWNQIERTIVNSGFDVTIDTIGNFISDKEMRKPIGSTCGKKSVKASRKPIKAATDISNPYIRIFLTNLGKYNEGELVGEWVDLPVDDFDEVLERIGINEQYEEYFITDYETNIPNLTIGEYDSIDELNDMASQIDGLDEGQILIMSARLYNGESFEDALAGCDDGSIYYDCYSDQDLGYEIIDQIGGTEQLDKDTLEMYFDYDGYGRDTRLNGSFIEIEPGTLVELY